MPEEKQYTRAPKPSTEDTIKATVEAVMSNMSGNTNNNTTPNGNIAVLKINERVREQDVKQQKYAARIKYEMDNDINCCLITIPEMFKKWQPSFTASVNGCTVNIPANGKTYKVHNDFAIIINRRMTRLSSKVSSMSTVDISEFNNNI